MQELVQGLGPALDAELESFVPLLLKRAGQVRRQAQPLRVGGALTWC
jgi:hypothetical protein